MKFLKSLLFVVISSSFCTLSAQETAGLIFGNYNGLNATKINPSWAFRSPHKWDIQLAGVHGFLQSDYAFVNQSNLFKTARNATNIREIFRREDNIPDSDELVLIYKDAVSDSYFQTKAELLGPGFMLNIKPNIKIGLITKVRAFGSAKKIPSVLNYYELNSTLLDVNYEAEGHGAAAGGWYELGLLYAQSINENLSFGIVLKYNVGIAGAFYNIDQGFSFQSPDLDNVNATSSGRFSLGITDVDTDGMHGSGQGIDLGITLNNVIVTGSQLGISLIDIGYTRYPGGTTSYAFDETTNLVRADYEGIRDENALQAQLSQDFNIVDSKDANRIIHPTALSLQFIHPIDDKIKLEGALTQRINLGKQQIRRANSLALAGIYETKNYSFYLPITIMDYKRIHPGLAFRVFFLTIGSDDLLSLFGNQQFNGSDLYVNLKVYPFGNKNKKSDGVECFSF